jgi:microcystin-dependent protein
MPFDSGGNYSLPTVYHAENGTTIQDTQHNAPLEDVQAALNGLVLRSGIASMTGQFKAVQGSAAAPGLAFTGATNFGFFKTANGIGVAVNGSQVAEFGAKGLISGGPPIGSGTDFWGTTAPAGWLFAYGQAVSRTTYAALFDAIGTTHGTGDGSTTFNLPDKRGRASFGKDDMGGTSANRITNQSGGWNGDTLGATGGAETHTLTEAQLAAHDHALTDPGHSHSLQYNSVTQPFAVLNLNNGAGAATAFVTPNAAGNFGVVANSTGITVNNAGGGEAHNNLPPGIVCNYIIFAGA